MSNDILKHFQKISIKKLSSKLSFFRMAAATIGTVSAVVGLIMAGGQASYWAGESVGYSGRMTNDWYQKHKGEIRLQVFLQNGPLGLAYHRLFEMGFYSTLK